MFAHACLVRGDIDAVDLVVGNEGLDPLDLRSHGAEHTTGGLGDGGELLRGEFARVGDGAFDDEFGHGCWSLSV